MRFSLPVLFSILPVAAGSGMGIVTTPPAVAADTCAVTPVHYVAYRGPGKAEARDIPWIAATPRSSHIVGFLFYNPAGVSGEAAFPHVDGNGPANGSTDKILWYVTTGMGMPRLKISGKNLSVPDTMRDVVPEAAPANNYPSILDVRSAGCWHLVIRNGQEKGHVTLEVLP